MAFLWIISWMHNWWMLMVELLTENPWENIYFGPLEGLERSLDGGTISSTTTGKGKISHLPLSSASISEKENEPIKKRRWVLWFWCSFALPYTLQRFMNKSIKELNEIQAPIWGGQSLMRMAAQNLLYGWCRSLISISVCTILIELLTSGP